MLRTRQAASQTYDRLSRWYDLLAGSEEHFTRLALESLAVQAGQVVLEIGSGTGKALISLAHHCGSPGLVAGLDLSQGMLKIAQRRLDRSNLSGKASLTLGDGAALPYPRERFDAVFMAFTLELFDTPEIPRVLQECRRVLRPGGRLGVVALSQSEIPSIIVRAYLWFHHHFPAAVDCRPIPADRFLIQAGFELIESRAGSMWGLPVALLIGQNP